MARTSFCVTAISRLAVAAAGRRRCGRLAVMRGDRAASEPSTTPSSEMMPARYISATTSMIAEPQMPVTPVAATAVFEARLVRP